MANAPKYVRLADHLSRGIRADIASGWSIAGLDVRPMPDEKTQPLAHQWVLREIAAGRLEGASKAEYDEAHEGDDILGALGVEVVRKVELTGLPNESHIMGEALAGHLGLREGREADTSEAVAEADAARKKATIKAAKKAASGKDASEDEAAAEEARLAAEQAAAEAAATKQS